MLCKACILYRFCQLCWQFVPTMRAFCAYYAGIMLNAFATCYTHNYAGIIGSSLAVRQWSWLNLIINACFPFVLFQKQLF